MRRFTQTSRFAQTVSISLVGIIVRFAFRLQGIGGLIVAIVLALPLILASNALVRGIRRKQCCSGVSGS